MPITKPRGWVSPLLRLLAFFATLFAVVVTVLNKQTKTMVVATIKTAPVEATVTTKFQHTPALVYFAIANGMASLHSLSMLIMELIGYKYDSKGRRFLIIAISDTMTVSLVSGGANAALYMAELSRNGNSHAGWNKICDKLGSYCDHQAWALAASIIGLVLLTITTVISIINVKTKSLSINSVVP